ncbi:MAG: response regulator, partial [Longimicrobiales bacterium]|nr:response regulator [Longimicrobiales bacterium]
MLPTEPGRRIRVLAVDDEPATLRLIQEILGQAGCDVLSGTTGQEALELALRAPDLILLDHHLPDVDGLEVCRRLQADPATSEIPVIFLTADHNPALEAHCLDAGARDFVTKPFADSVLLARLQTHLALSARTRTLERMAHTDDLTGLANRRYFENVLDREWSRTRRSEKPLSLLLVDLDHFKDVNDTYGHQEGDRC